MYYKSIDGLRALAVGLVLLFHADVAWARGGFIGVDIFYVISGILITGNILRDKAGAGFSFRGFYARRIARLLPALLVTLLATLAVGFALLMPDELLRLAQTALAAGLSVSNIYFWLQSGYFEPSAHTQPLLHTWSLGVEEQFYFVWPLLIVLLASFRSRGILCVGLAFIAGVSLAAAAYFEPTAPAAVFYLTPFRAFQFALGGLLTLAPIRAGLARSIVGAVGAISAICLGYFANGASANLLLNAIAPALAAGCIIWGAESVAVKAVFAAPPLRWIGARSYSIYLVHWPIGVFWALSSGTQPSPFQSALLIASAIVLGALLHATVEKPFRLKPGVSPRRTTISLATAGILLACVAGLATFYWRGDGLPSRLDARMRAAQLNFTALREASRRARGVGHCVVNWDRQTPNDYDEAYCAPPHAPGSGAWLVLGDSWAANSYLVFKDAYPEVKFDLFAAPGCPLRSLDDLQHSDRPMCRELFARGIGLAQPSRYAGVILSSSWDAPYQPIADLVSMLHARGLRIIVTGQYVMFRQAVPDVIFHASSFRSAEMSLDALADRERAAKDDQLGPLVQESATFIDMIPLQCAPRCEVLDRAMQAMYFDTSHLTLAGAAILGPRLRDAHPDLFANGHRT